MPPLIPDGYFLFHYLDDFLRLRPDRERLCSITGDLVRALRAASFIVSPKSTLEPTREKNFP